MDIKPYDKNSKKHDDKQLKLIAGSIKRFGWQQPIKVGKDKVILVGHGRWLAYKKYPEGIKEPWIIDEDGKTISGEAEKRKLTAKEEVAYRLADNQINALTGFDMSLVIDDLKGLDTELLDLTGFSRDLIIEGNEADDIIPDNAPPVAKLGDVWALGRHRVGCMDSTDKASVEKLMDDKKADMVFCDPPYGMGLETDYSKLTSENSFASGKKHSKVIGDDKEYNPTHIFDQLGYCNEIFLWGADYYRKYVPIGGSWMVWDKREGESADKGFGSNFELLWSKQNHKRYILRYKWFGFFTAGEKREYLHPTQKPVEMLRQVISPYCKDNGLVVDLFLGSGSTLIACEKTNRICYGMEIDPKYTDVIIKRWEDYTQQKAVKL